MGNVADPYYLLCMLRHRWLGGGATLKNERCDTMFSDLTIDTLLIKLERVHVLADILLDLLAGQPEAQVLTEIIVETSTVPEA